VTRSNTV